MKNINKSNGKNLLNNNRTGSGKIVFAQLKKFPRKALSLVFIYALVIVPLLTMDSAMPKTFAQFDPCVGANRIFQHCSLGGGQVETDMTNAAIDDVIEFYKLPANERDRVMSYGRNEVRAMLYVRLLQLINKENRRLPPNSRHLPRLQVASNKNASKPHSRRKLITTIGIIIAVNFSRRRLFRMTPARRVIRV